MSVGLLVIALVAVLVVDAILLAALVSPWLGRRPGEDRGPARDLLPAELADLGGVASVDPRLGPGGGAVVSACDRIVRVASWSFILVAGIVVVATDLWPTRETAILAVLGIAGLFVLVAHDVLPAAALGRAGYLVEGTVAIVFVTLVVGLTGGARSPFFFGYALIVAGAALVVRPPVTLALAAIAGGGYLAVAVADAAGGSQDPASVAIVAVNLTALVLLAYVASVVAREQRRTRDAAIRLSTLDGLTGLANRGFFLAVLEREIERSRRYDRGFCLLMADLDDLKALNDTHGHRMGDRALVGLANVIREGIRRIDTAARLGGDEFVVLLPETEVSGALVVAEKIRQGTAAIVLGDRAGRVPVNVSVGLVAWPEDGRSVDELMAAVDGAMYAAKRRGKARGVGIEERAAADPPGDDERLRVPVPIGGGARPR